MPLGNGLVEGFIDLLFEEEGRIIIADYKTDVLDDGAEEERMGQYSLQAGAYALAVYGVTGKTVKEVVLVFVRSGKEISLTNIVELQDKAHEKAVALFH